jgi:hypothetical protein
MQREKKKSEGETESECVKCEDREFRNEIVMRKKIKGK